MKSNKSTWKRTLAVCLTFALSLVLVWQPVGKSQVEAATASSTEYVKDIKVFSVKGSVEEAKQKAEEWCKAQTDGKWKVVDGDLNSGAAGALNKDVAVYLVYQTTTDPHEAITDLAVMNEKGNYSEAEYKALIESQKQLYKDLVDDMHDMLKEYRANVKNGVDTALQAQKYMNGYVEDDSKKPLGDFLLDATDEELIPVLMQANGRVVMMIQEKLAYACDTAKTTWLERMEKLGSYEKLRDKALKAYNNDATKADKALEMNYADKAREILESWTDIAIHIGHVKRYNENNKISDMSEQEYVEWCKNTADDEEATRYRDEIAVMKKLATYKYENGTLLDYFSQDSWDLAKQNCRKLYPLVACMTEGQLAAINESVSMFALVMNASSASAFNGNNTDENKKIENEMTAEDKKVIEETEKKIDATLDKWEKINISIYDGVDRDVFKDGVAVTSAAKNYSNGSEKSWAEALIDNYELTPVMKGLAIGTGVFALGSIVSSICYARKIKNVAEDEFGWVLDKYEYFNQEANIAWRMEDTVNEAKWDKAVNELKEEYEGVRFWDEGKRMAYDDQTSASKQKLLEKALTGDSSNALKTKILKGIKIGLTVATILLSAADIAIAGIALYKYYNREHLPIPHHIVDMSYNEKKETSFVAYKSVLDTDGNYGDLNGGGGKQWLALYVSREQEAGDPILADEFLVKKGSAESPEGNGYLPLHLFGTPGVAQNLTFADGENGWSFNDNENGTYLYFQSDITAFFNDTSQTGTAISGGIVALVGVIGFIAGGFVVAIVGGTRRKKTIIRDSKD